MGGSGGTEIFDCVADELLELNHYSYIDGVPLATVMNILSKVKSKLYDLDWDDKYNSVYWTHPKIGRILGNTFEEEDDE